METSSESMVMSYFPYIIPFECPNKFLKTTDPESLCNIRYIFTSTTDEPIVVDVIDDGTIGFWFTTCIMAHYPDKIPIPDVTETTYHKLEIFKNINYGSIIPEYIRSHTKTLAIKRYKSSTNQATLLCITFSDSDGNPVIENEKACSFVCYNDKSYDLLADDTCPERIISVTHNNISVIWSV